jgi:predicted PurR-regulated permease PerM
VSTSVPPRLPSGERLRRAGIAAWSIIGLVIVAAIAVYVLLKIRVVFPPLVLALLLIYMLNPLIARLERRGVARPLGTFFAYVVFIGITTLILMATIPYFADQVSGFSEDWPEFREQTVDFVDDTAASFEDRLGIEINTTQVDCLLGADEIDAPTSPTEERCDQVVENFRDRFAEQAGNFTEIGRSVLEVLLVFVLAPLIALYILIDLPQLQRDVLNLIPPSHREEFRDLANKIGRAIGGFFRGQLLVAFLVGLLSAIGFRIIGLPFWFVIGGIAGFFNLIPLIGPFIGGGIGFLVGTITGGVGLGLQAALVELIVQQFDNHIVSPNVMRRTVQLHPVTVMLALLAGGTLAGFWGVFLGVPAVAVAKILASHVWATRVLGVEPSPYATTVASDPPSVVPEEVSGPKA